MRKTINGSPGLYTAANAEILPPGSLLGAKGVVIRRPGVIQPARPFRQYSFGGDSVFTGTAYSIGFYSGRFYIANGSGRLWYESGTHGVFTDSTYLVNKAMRMAEANNNLYFPGPFKTSASATRGSTGKMDATGGTPYAAGCPRALDPIVSTLTPGTLFTAGQSRSYRAVLTFKDANGNLVFGAPSGPVTLLATGAQDGQAKVLLPADVYNAANATSYRVQLYASNVVASGSNPDDEMQLVADYGITATDVANKNVTISDNTPDNLKGILGSAYLYTNPSQQTIAAANYPPPIANDLALFKGSLFMANTTQKHRASLTMLAPPEFWAVQAVSAANVPGAGQVTYTFLAAVDLTGIDNTMKLSVTGTAANNGEFPIVSVNNGTHTVVVTAAGGGAAGVLGTAITGKLTIGNTSYFPIFGTSSVANHYYTVPSTGTSQAKVSAATISLVQIANQQTAADVVLYNVTSPLSPAGEMQLEEKSIGGSAFTATANGTTTAGYRGAFSITFAPAIPSATPLTSLNDNRKNRLHFSKSGQPEHFPLSDSYFFDIGSASKAILRIVPLRQALLVFKEDGLFRVTGDAGVFAWAPYDTTQVLLAADLVATIQNTAVAVTIRGMWQFSETSSRYLSGPVEDRINVITASLSPGVANLNAGAVSGISSSEADGLVYLHATTSVGDSVVQFVSLVYSVQTGAWSEQYGGGDGTNVAFPQMRFVSVSGFRYGIAVGSSTFDVYQEDQADVFNDYGSANGDPVPGHKYLVNITNVDAGASQLLASARGGPTLTVGSLIADENHSVYRVTVANGALLTLSLLYGSGGFTFDVGVYVYAYAPQPIQIDYQPFTNGEDGEMKEFTELLAIMDPASTTTSGSVSIGAYGENWSSAQMTMVADTRNTATSPMLHRIGVEGNAMVARRLAVRVTHSNPLEYFYLRGISYKFNETPNAVATN